MIGQIISHYKILEVLGEGGMGVVYKAQDTKLDRFVALKFLPPQLSSTAQDRSRFIQEAKAASALNHPNILTIYDFIEEKGHGFIVMELVEGESLKNKVEKAKEYKTQIELSLVIDYAQQIAQGLSKAHAKGIIHRDIKSENIMVTSDGLVKIMDFGLAKLRGKAGVTRDGSTVGTAAYMSPEQIQGEEVSEQADVWSFGVVLFQLLTSQLPFHGEHESAMMYSIANEDPKPLGTLRADVPPQLRKITESCLQKDRSQRFASMSQVLEEISKLKPAAGIEVKPLSLKTILNGLKRPVVAIPTLLIFLGLGYLSYAYVERSANTRLAKERVLPEIDRLVGESKWAQAYFLARQNDNVLAYDPLFVKLRPLYAAQGLIRTEPPGAEVLIAEYGTAPENWISLGSTPTDTIPLPRGLWRLKFQKQGFITFDGAGSVGLVNEGAIKLDPTGLIPEHMTRVLGGKLELNLPGLEGVEPIALGDYFIDKYEVTNKEFKRFVEAGGYQRREFWKYPFLENGKELSWQEALVKFKDKTGRPGPSTWEVGSYPQGQDDYPLAGVSWYEAAAFAEFAGKSLPSIFHWNRAAGTGASSFIVPQSNFSDRGPDPVGKNKGIGPFGTFDMAGNVREWCYNVSEKNRFILGGGWNDQTYMFNDPYTQPPFDRSVTNGFRCVKYLEENANLDRSVAEFKNPFRDFYKEKPVSDQVFKFYLRLFDYDQTNLDAKVEVRDTMQEWIRERITFNAAYGNDRVIVHLFLPRVSSPPYQTVIYFPGSNAVFDRSSETALQLSVIDFIMKSGRAVLYPVYYGTYERNHGVTSDQPNETNAYKEWVIQMAKDIRRSVDYLETRKDIDKQRLAYYGLSWGGRLGGLMVALENRFKVSILYVAGLKFQKSLPEVDPLNYVSHIKIPVLMLNGKYDQFFPVETSQKPFFTLLGTPSEKKKYVLYESGHFVPRNQLIKESLDWLDKYLGPVR